MVEHSKLHSWVNTTVACLAIFISGFSAFVSWKSYSVNVETFGFSSDFTYDCPFVIGKYRVEGKSTGQDIGLCWRIMVANQSSSRASIISYTSAMLSEDGPSERLPAEILDRKGTYLLLPINFDGGEAQTIIMRVMLPITDAFDKIITDTIKSHAVEIRTLTDAAVVAAQAKMDVLGNPVSVSEFGRFGYIITASPHYKKTVAVLRLHSGRDKVFETQLTYPNDINIVFRLRDDAHPG